MIQVVRACARAILLVCRAWASVAYSLGNHNVSLVNRVFAPLTISARYPHEGGPTGRRISWTAPCCPPGRAPPPKPWWPASARGGASRTCAWSGACLCVCLCVLTVSIDHAIRWPMKMKRRQSCGGIKNAYAFSRQKVLYVLGQRQSMKQNWWANRRKTSSSESVH